MTTDDRDDDTTPDPPGSGMITINLAISFEPEELDFIRAAAENSGQTLEAWAVEQLLTAAFCESSCGHEPTAKARGLADESRPDSEVRCQRSPP